MDKRITYAITTLAAIVAADPLHPLWDDCVQALDGLLHFQREKVPHEPITFSRAIMDAEMRSEN